MPLLRWSRVRRRLLAPAVAGAVVLPLFVLLPVAQADDEPAAETVVGELVQTWVEHEDPREAAAEADQGLLSFVRTTDGEAVRIPTEEVADLPLGATVELMVGDAVADEAAVEDGYEPAREVLTAEVIEAAPVQAATSPAAVPLGHRVTVVLVTPPGSEQDGTTLADVVDTVNGPVNDFWEEQASESVGVVASHDWMETDADCSDPYALWDEVADEVGFVTTLREHLLVYISSAPADVECAYGLGEVGPSTGNGGYAYVRAAETPVIAHELGHNMGLKHSSARQCDRAVETGVCRTVAYADYYDVMGYSWGPIGSLNLGQAATFPILTTSIREIRPTMAPETVTITPVSQRAGVRGVRLGGGPGQVYWLEYRPSSGRDAWLATSDNVPGLEPGVLLRHAPGVGAHQSLLLDGTPSARAGWNGDLGAALPVGTPIPVAGGDFVVTVVGMNAGSATIHVEPVGQGPAKPPVGSLDGVSVIGGRLAVHGWALDLNRPVSTLDVRVVVDGRTSVVPAAGLRADIGALYPSAGRRHGFAFSAPVTAGRHTVCAHALDPSGWGSTALGCRVVTSVSRPPVGTLDRVSLAGRTLTVGGWAVDADSPTAAVAVHVYLDGRAVAVAANRPRADVGRAYPAAGSAHGFTFATALTAGPHRVCAYAIDTAGPGSTALGCRTVTYIPVLPRGSLDRVGVSGGVLTLSGWAVDTETPGVSGGVHVYVDNRAARLTADRPRADVGRAFAGAGNAHGFAFSAPVAPGNHRVCAYAIDTEGQGSALLGCRTITA